MGINKFIILLFAFITFSCKESQNDISSCSNCLEVKYGTDATMQFRPDTFAKYPNGIEGINEHIINNVKYPKAAVLEQIQGRVVVSYVVTQEGKVAKVEISEGVSKELDEEAIRVIKLMTDWEPAYLNGKPVSIEYTQPISFQL